MPFAFKSWETAVIMSLKSSSQSAVYKSIPLTNVGSPAVVPAETADVTIPTSCLIVFATPTHPKLTLSTLSTKTWS